MWPYLERRALQMIKLRWYHTGVERVLIQRLVSLPKEDKRQRPTRIRPWNDQGRDRSDMSLSQGTPRTSSNTRSWETHGTDPPWQPSQTAGSCQHLDSGMLGFGTQRGCISAVLSSLGCGTFQGQPWETHTGHRSRKHLWNTYCPGSSLGAQPPEMQKETNKTHRYPWETLS